jgi:hypothetical protein
MAWQYMAIGGGALQIGALPSLKEPYSKARSEIWDEATAHPHPPPPARSAQHARTRCSGMGFQYLGFQYWCPVWRGICTKQYAKHDIPHCTLFWQLMDKLAEKHKLALDLNSSKHRTLAGSAAEKQTTEQTNNGTNKQRNKQTTEQANQLEVSSSAPR